MSFRKLFKKLCIFGSVASLALGIFSTSVKAVSGPFAGTVAGKLYGFSVLSDLGLTPIVNFNEMNKYNMKGSIIKTNSTAITSGDGGCAIIDKDGDEVSTKTNGKSVALYLKVVKDNDDTGNSGDWVLVRLGDHTFDNDDASWNNLTGENSGVMDNTKNWKTNGGIIGTSNLKIPGYGKYKVYYYIDKGSYEVDDDKINQDLV